MVRAVVALVALVAVPAAAALRGDPPPPYDIDPVWSPDGSAIVYTRGDVRSGIALRVFETRGAGDRPLPASIGVLSPDWRWLASVEPGLPPAIVISTPEGAERRRLVAGSAPVWAPSGERLAFRPPAQLNQAPGIDVVELDGSGRRQLAELAEQPAWSPDGRRVAFRDLSTNSPTFVGVVDADGRNRRALVTAGDDPTSWGWSPDGGTLAVLARSDARAELNFPLGSTLALVRLRDGRVRKFALPGLSSSLDWSPDGRYIALDGVFRFDVARGRAFRLARFGVLPRFSPDGTQIAFVGGGACGTRSGIYIVSTLGSRPARRTNDCVVTGGPGADTLRGGEFTDVLLGLGGDDVLTALDDFYYEGDELDGGAGNDRLTGSFGTDVLRGGPGRDVLDGGGAPDVVYAVDGERDVVACGTSRGDVERDRAYVDRRDVVREDCEYVFRRGTASSMNRTWFTITVWPRGRAGPSHRRTLQCSPPRGTLRDPAVACAKLSRFGDPFAPIPLGTDCPTRAAEQALARVVGRFRGRHVTVWMQRADGCEIARWDRFGFLFVS